jgi:hypothetical protein
MSTVNRCPLLALLVVTASALAGCTGSDVDAPTAERFPPEKAAEVALERYDTNSDGTISRAELDECLALKYSLPRMDANGDKALSGAEIADRIRAYENQSALSALTVQVVSRRGPVAGAKAVLEFESFMAPNVPTYVVTTDESGSGTPKLQEGDQAVLGIPTGFYRVTISPPDGEKVVRGFEVADDAPTANRVVFSLETEAPLGGGGR